MKVKKITFELIIYIFPITVQLIKESIAAQQ